jgi:hypothetical protein
MFLLNSLRGMIRQATTRRQGNEATGGAAGASGTEGLGQGGGVYIAPGGTVSVRHTRITRNHASTSNDNVFGDLSIDG